MNMTQQILEILIGKYLDGEITASEQQMLDAALDGDPEARELFEQLKILQKLCQEVIDSGILERGKAPAEIFEQAWSRTKIGIDTPEDSRARINNRTLSKSRFWCGIAGLAAGLAIGLALHFVLPRYLTTRENPAQPTVAINNAESPTLQSYGDGATNIRDVVRNVDWYSFTDKDGGQWLIEGLRENVIKPAVYDSEL